MMPARGRILVKHIETPEQLGSIVLTDAARAELTAWQMEVVAVGAPTICEEWDCERPHDEAGHAEGLRREHRGFICPLDWVLLAPRSLTETDVDGLYCCQQDDVLAVLQP